MLISEILRVFDMRRPMTGVQAVFFNRLASRINKPIFYGFEIILGEKLERSRNLLDIGTGPGHFPIILAEVFPHLRIVGIDPSDDMMREAEKNLARSGVKNVEFRRGDALNLPFPPSSFDVVTANFTIKHWPDIKKGLLEIARVLKRDGVAWIIEVERNPEPKKIKNLFETSSFEMKLLVLPVLRFVVVRGGVSAPELNSFLGGVPLKGRFKTAKHLPVVWAILKK